MQKRQKFAAYFFLFLTLIPLACNKKTSVENDSPYPQATAQQMDAAALADVVDNLAQLPSMHCLLIARNNVTVLEEYFNGASANSVHDVRSVTKSVISALIGMAIDQGLIPSVTAPIGPYLEEFTDAMNNGHYQITIENLLTMSSGIEWDENIVTEYIPWINAADQIGYLFQFPVIHTPGSYFVYNSGASHQLSPILESAAGGSLMEFAEEYLFTPLGILNPSWNTVSHDHCNGSAGLWLTGRDMMKLGLLYLNGGIFDQQQIISSSWIDATAAAHVSTRNTAPFGQNYGYLWWNGSHQGHHYFYANGYGGQFIVICPALNIVVVSQCDWRINAELAGNNWYTILNAILTNVLAAAE